uniref:Uncharacterized protein n=1 Tax=Anguilla anguilla TaxID=7936 RepID=A0A0E9X0H5_ANGAN
MTACSPVARSTGLYVLVSKNKTKCKILPVVKIHSGKYTNKHSFYAFSYYNSEKVTRWETYICSGSQTKRKRNLFKMMCKMLERVNWGAG